MKWILVVLVLVSGCRAVGDSFSCLLDHDDEWERKSCESQRASARAHDRSNGREAEEREVRERDDDLRAREAYRAAIEPCRDGHARACFVTALYEDRHGAPSAQVEGRYRFACVSGIGRACFMAGEHARTRGDGDPMNLQQLALASFAHGCQLGDGESCRAGLELDPARTDLLEAGCAARYRWACERLGR